MTRWDNLMRSGRRLAGDVRASVARARIEGERRLLQRQHRSAAERLGERAWELARAGDLDPTPLRAEIDDVDRLLAEIAAKVAEIDELRDEGPDSGPPPPTAPTGWEDAERFFRT